LNNINKLVQLSIKYSESNKEIVNGQIHKIIQNKLIIKDKNNTHLIDISQITNLQFIDEPFLTQDNNIEKVNSLVFKYKGEGGLCKIT